MNHLTAEQLNRRVEELRRMAARPAGDHLTDQEAIEYCVGGLTAAERSRIEVHLDSCGACCRDVDVLSHIDDIEKERRLLPWLADQLKQLGAPLRERAFNRTLPAAFGKHLIRRTLRLPLALPSQFIPVLEGQAFGTVTSFESSTPDKQLRWRIVDEGPEVVVTFVTVIDDLVDMPAVRLHFGEAVEDVVFGRCAGKIVSTVVFSKAQLGAWRPTDVLQLGLEGFDEGPSG